VVPAIYVFEERTSSLKHEHAYSREKQLINDKVRITHQQTSIHSNQPAAAFPSCFKQTRCSNVCSFRYDSQQHYIYTQTNHLTKENYIRKCSSGGLVFAQHRKSEMKTSGVQPESSRTGL
jgi:hypothetical protein